MPDLDPASGKLRDRLKFHAITKKLSALVRDTNGLNDEGATNMISIREGVMKFRKSLDQNEKLASDSLCGKMAGQIDKYLDQLFNDPIMVDTPSGCVMLYPQRTNNILEHFFRELSRENRRKTGCNSKQRMLKNMLADTPLVKNLANPDYMNLLLNGKTDLEQLFAGMNPISLKSELQSGVDRILPGFRKITQLPALPDYFIRLANQHIQPLIFVSFPGIGIVTVVAFPFISGIMRGDLN